MADTPHSAALAANALPSMFASFDRGTLASAVEVLVAVLDAMDGDPDDEPDGDEQDGQFGEDEPATRFARMRNAPGCPVADPDKAIDDDGCDDINDDREHESELICAFGLDQTRLLPRDCHGHEPVPDWPCAPI